MQKSKILIGSLILSLTLGFTTQSWAATCAGGAGTEITGKDGLKYCVSNIQMNWWSAFAWCEGAGMKLVPLDRCNGKDPENPVLGTTACPNFTLGSGYGDCWTSSVPSSASAYRVTLSSGAVEIRYRKDNATDYYALCE